MSRTTTYALAVFFWALLFTPSAWATDWYWNLTGSSDVGATGTFEGCEATTKTKLSGTFTRPTTGFVKLTTTACQTCSGSAGTCSGYTGCSANGGECAGASTTLYALENPGEYLIVQPTLAAPTLETQPIYNVLASSSCPSMAMTYNFIFSQFSLTNDTSSPFQVVTGEFNWTPPNTATALNAYNATSMGALGFPSFTNPNTGCSNGVITMTGVGDRGGSVYITPSGMFFTKTAANHALFGMVQKPVLDVRTLDGVYSGFAYSATGTNSVIPVRDMIVGSGANMVSGYGMNTDGSLNNSIVRQFQFNASDVNEPVDGMIRGTLFDGSYSSNMICLADVSRVGRNQLFCGGQTPGNTSAPYNMLLTSTQGTVWLGGSKAIGATANYGTQGTPAAGNIPGAAQGGATWTDALGTLYLFAGSGNVASGGGSGYLNDMWRYDPLTNQWTFLNGSKLPNQNGVYGTQGTPDPANRPGGRYLCAKWSDGQGNLYLFGGEGYGETGTWGSLSDLWKYNIATNQWTYLKGNKAVNLNGVYGTVGVADVNNKPGGRRETLSFVDSAGLFWMFGGYGYPASGALNDTSDLWKYDPGTNNWTFVKGNTTGGATGVYGIQGTPDVNNKPGGKSDAMGWIDSQDNIYVYGGFGVPASGQSGQLSDLWKYIRSSNSWVYLKGNTSTSDNGIYGTQGTPASTNKPGSREGAITWIDGQGNLYLMGGDGFGETGSKLRQSDLWRYTPATNNWTWLKGDKVGSQFGVYGTQGTPGAANKPGARFAQASWADPRGSAYVFGGSGWGESGSLGIINDLWKLTSFTQTTAPIRAEVRPQGTVTGHDFGTLSSGTVVDYTITLAHVSGTNTPAVTLNVVSPALASPFAYKGGTFPGTGGTCSDGGTISAGGTCTIVVRLTTPAATTPFSGGINLSYYDGTSTRYLQYFLTGNKMLPSLAFSDSPYNFGTYPKSTTVDKTITVTSNGDGTAASMVGSMTGDTTRIRFKGGSYPGTGGTCGVSLNQGSTCTFVVSLTTPNGGGSTTYNTVLTITHSYGSTAISMSGTYQ